MAGHDRHLFVAEKDDVARMTEQGGDIGGHEELVVAEADDNRRTVANRHDLVRIVGRHDDQREQPAEQQQQSADGLPERTAVDQLLFNQCATISVSVSVTNR